MKHFLSAPLAAILLIFSLRIWAGEFAQHSEEQAHENLQQFIAASFAGLSGEAQRKTFWMDADFKAQVYKQFNYQFAQLRLRYWRLDARTLWVLEEIGKESPITIGIVVENNEIVDVEILAYRESRGGEVQHAFFTDQFDGLKLDTERTPKLDGRIDGITGATLSVRAVKKVATLALFLHARADLDT